MSPALIAALCAFGVLVTALLLTRHYQNQED